MFSFATLCKAAEWRYSLQGSSADRHPKAATLLLAGLQRFDRAKRLPSQGNAAISEPVRVSPKGNRKKQT
jgi:hypothetical protein